MAIMETKIIQVDNSPSVINASNEEWGRFGWSVQNVQVTHSQDTRTYTKSLSDLYTGSKTVETITINYATITYQRDKNMSNYQKVAELEREYEGINAELYAGESISSEAQPLNMGIMVALVVLFWPGAVLYYLNNRKKKGEAEKKYIQFRNSDRYNSMISRRQQILAEVDSLIVE